MSDRQSALIDVRVLLLRESEVLLLRRSDPLFPGWWNLPGGHVMADENAVQAALRELKEEAGVTVLPAHLRFAAVCHFKPSGRRPKVGFSFVANRWNGIPRIAEPGKFSAVEWHPAAKLPDLLMPHAAEMMRLHSSGVEFSAHGWDENMQANMWI